MALATLNQAGLTPGNATAIGTVPALWSGTITYASETEAKFIDVNLRYDSDGRTSMFMYGNFWVKIEQTSASAEAVDDVDVQFRPLMVNAAGTLTTTQQAAEDIKNAAAFDTNTLHGYDLNQMIKRIGDDEQYLGGDGFRIQLLPAAEMNGVFAIEIIGR